MAPAKNSGKDGNPNQGVNQKRLSPESGLDNHILARTPEKGNLAAIAPACKHDQVKRHGHDPLRQPAVPMCSLR